MDHPPGGEQSVLVPPPIMDIEASGFGAGSYPIEVGIVMPDGAAWCSLIKPAASWTHWDEKAALVHGITRKQLIEHGRSPQEITRELNDWLCGMTVYCDAWAHDYSWLNCLYDMADRRPTFKLDNLRATLSDIQAAQWHDAKNRISLAMHAQRHRASCDARVLQQTWMAVQGRAQAAA